MDQLEYEAAVSKGKAWFIGAAVLAVAALLSSFLIVSGVKANADYICTHVIDETSECGNGSWGGWESVSSSQDVPACVVTAVERRTYTGTRVVRHILTYLNLRTACESGYTQARVGSGGGSSGNQGRGGTIVTESSACQIVETKTTRSSLTTGACQTKPTTNPVVTTTTATSDTGVTQTEEGVGAVSDLDRFRESMIAARIWAVPVLVRSGTASTIHWQGREVTACTVAGANGDGTGSNDTGAWTGTSGEHMTSAISNATLYTLTCTAFNGTTVTGTTTVSIAPIFQEQ